MTELRGFEYGQEVLDEVTKILKSDTRYVATLQGIVLQYTVVDHSESDSSILCQK